MSGRSSDELRIAWLDLLYPLPRPFESREEYERFMHADLPRRPRAELARERERLRDRLVHDDDPDPWLLIRMTKLTEILDRAR